MLTTFNHITYGITFTVWGGNSTNLEKVFRAQKKCVRSLYKIKRRRKFKGSYIYGHTKQIFSTNSFLTAHNLYNFSMISDAFKVITSKAPTSYYKNCYQVSSIYETWQAPQLKMLTVFTKNKFPSYDSHIMEQLLLSQRNI